MNLKQAIQHNWSVATGLSLLVWYVYPVFSYFAVRKRVGNRMWPVLFSLHLSSKLSFVCNISLKCLYGFLNKVQICLSQIDSLGLFFLKYRDGFLMR